MALFGTFALQLALFLSGYAIIVDLFGAGLKDRGLRRSGRNATLACWICLTAAIYALLSALLKGDFSIIYVVEHTSRDLHWAYKFSALWAGASGSLLVWLWLQVSLALWAFGQDDQAAGAFTASARSAVNLVSCFFLVLLVFDRDVFELMTSPVADGRGLNPPLRHPAMVLHPPTLFIGYAAYVIPFAWAVAVLIMSRPDERPLLFGKVWTWALAAWIFLTIGNALGSWWAYEELGWGGFWAWDPVENSSFMPWLTGTALLHSFKKYRPQAKMARWVIFLSLFTYSLCIFGRYLAKVGLVESVHTFGDKGLGNLYLLLLVIFWFVIFVLALVKYVSAKPRLIPTTNRGEGVLLLNNWLLLILFMAIMVGTLFEFLSGLVIEYAPGITGWFTDRPVTNAVTLDAEFFNKMTAPGGLLLLFLTGLCPYFFRRGWNWKWRSWGGLVVIGVALVFWVWYCNPDTVRRPGFSGGINWFFQWFSSGSPKVPCFIISGYVALNIVVDFMKFGVKKTSGSASGQRSRRSLSWYGARVAHIGVVLIFLGISGSEGYDMEGLNRMKVGDTVTIKRESIRIGGITMIKERDYEISFDELIPARTVEYQVQAARMTVKKNGELLAVMEPSWRYYANFRPTSEPAIRRTAAGDFYLSITGMEPAAQLINLRVLIKPLVNWLWIGCLSLATGALMVLVSRVSRRQPQAEKTG